jgi:prepilin-type N-terminal cleavage/methylation domain-containing protein
VNARISAQLRRFRDEPESGLSLIEVIVAMLIFAIIALGVGYSIISTLHAAKDAKGREVALNLAAQEIDSVRSVSDIFAVGDLKRTVTVPGDTTAFTIDRTSDWVTSNGTVANCGSGGGTLQYKQVNVKVTWDGMIASNPVRADTIIAPASTINDPDLGTILVKVTNNVGVGVQGASVTLTAAASGTPAVTVVPPATDADGCSYVLKIPPGSYQVKVALANYIDINQSTTPTTPSTAPVVVTAGAIGTAGFTYDLAGSVTVKYASNWTGTTPNFPNNMTTSFTSTLGGTDVMPAATPFKLYPVSYAVVAGGFVPGPTPATSCANVDPSQWPDGTVSGKAVSSPDPATAVVSPGGILSGLTAVNVPMGVFTAKGNKYVTATPATAPSGSADPGCAAPPTSQLTYTFGPLTSGTYILALPYGSYTFKSGSSATGSQSTIAGSDLGSPAGAKGVTVTGNVLTLDPRVATP